MGRYRDATPLSTSPLSDDLATAPSGPVYGLGVPCVTVVILNLYFGRISPRPPCFLWSSWSLDPRRQLWRQLPGFELTHNSPLLKPANKRNWNNRRHRCIWWSHVPAMAVVLKMRSTMWTKPFNTQFKLQFYFFLAAFVVQWFKCLADSLFIWYILPSESYIIFSSLNK